MTTQNTLTKQEENLLLVPRDKNDVRSFLESESTIQAISKAANGMIDPVQMASTVCQIILKTPALMRCTKMVIYSAMIKLSQLGCPPDGIHGYLVPINMKNHRTGKYDVPGCLPVESARGLLRVFRINGVKGIHSGVIRKNDVFEWCLRDGNLNMFHHPDLWSESEILGFFFIWEIDGLKEGVVMSKKEVDAIMARSKSKDEYGNPTGPWKTDYVEMGIKTVIKRGAKRIPLPISVAQAMSQTDEDEYAGMRNATPAKKIFSESIDPTLNPDELLGHDEPTGEDEQQSLDV